MNKENKTFTKSCRLHFEFGADGRRTLHSICHTVIDNEDHGKPFWFLFCFCGGKNISRCDNTYQLTSNVECRTKLTFV